MSKIGRNDLCPCGSGKKYKKCHWGENSAHPIAADISSESDVSTFADLIRNFRGMPILRLLAHLQAMPGNHGRNFSFELMATEVIRQLPEDDHRPFMPWGQLVRAIRLGQSFGDEEPENLFTENVISANGNQIVFPGVYRNGTTILNELLEIILTGENALPDEFKRLVYAAGGMLLLLSDQIANGLGYNRYQSGHISENLDLPGYGDFIEAIDTFLFDREYLDQIAKLYGYNTDLLEHFMLDPKAPALQNDDPENALVSKKPLIKDGDKCFVFMPTTIVSSIIDFIYVQAEKFSCKDLLIKMFHKEQFFRASSSLSFLGWQATNINLPKSEVRTAYRELVWRFDNQKFGYLIYVPMEVLDREASASSVLAERVKEVIPYLRSLEVEMGYEILTLVVLSETGNGEYFMMPKLSETDRYLYLTMSELATIAYDKKSDILTLWKFSGVFKDAAERYELSPVTEMLNLYAVYRQNNGSLMDTDAERPDGAMLIILPGYDLKLRQEVKLLRDEHAARLLIEGGRLAFVNVIRKREFAPIYAFKNAHSKEYRRLLDSFKMPIWITNYQENTNLLVNEVAEALMFWLYRSEEFLSPILEDLSLVQFEIELLVDENMFNGSEFIIKTVDPEAVIIEIRVNAPKIQISIPHEFIYLMARSDNEGEKMLLRAVLQGMVYYVNEAKREIKMNSEIIEQIVTQTMQPDEAKMILFTDASVNVELDSRNLPPEHYLQDADSSYVLDNLTNYLPKGYDIPEKIEDIKIKIALCDAIVTGIIGELTRRINEFDAAGLIKWLVKWNERCTFTREMREIRTPAKIACFENFEDEVNEIKRNDSLLVPTTLSIRTLVEFVAANPPMGKKVSNYADIDILLALVDELTNFGSLSEAMRMGLNNPDMGLLPSGRIGTDKSFQHQVLMPYTHARTTGTVAKFVERFQQRYVFNYDRQIENTPKSIEADEAYRAEFGVGLNDIADVTGVLINHGFTRTESCSVLHEVDFFKLLNTELPDKGGEVIMKTVELMTLLQRSAIGSFPKGYSPIDIFPWRFGRNLSYLRRPLVSLKNSDGSSSFYFGFRHLKSFFENLLFLLFTGKLPENDSKEMSSFLGKINHEKGTPFRNEVKDWMKANMDLQVIEHEVKIEPGGHIDADIEYGDSDVMAVDHIRKEIYSIECKNLIGARNIHEMKNEIDLYLGREGQEAKAKINKHVKRHKYLQENPEKVRAFLGYGPEDYKVISLVLSAEEMPIAYIAKGRVPLPIVSFHRLKIEGQPSLYQIDQTLAV